MIIIVINKCVPMYNIQTLGELKTSDNLIVIAVNYAIVIKKNCLNVSKHFQIISMSHTAFQ